MAGLDKGVVLCAVILAVVTVGFPSAAVSISDDPLMSTTGGRALLQAKKDCPISFDGSNVTIITSRCKGPLYQASLCCPAYQQYACFYAQYVNDLTYDCMDMMISYIRLYGKYPPGIFSNACGAGDGHNEAFDCPEGTPQFNPGQKTQTSAAVMVGAAPVMAALCVSMSMLSLTFLRI